MSVTDENNVIKVLGENCEIGGLYASIADCVCEYLHIEGKAVAELDFCDEEEIRELNRTTRGIDKVTDVLSFPTFELTPGEYEPFYPTKFRYACDPQSGRVYVGSIMICEAVAKRQAEEYGHSQERERGYLFLHGLLHLLGYDHIQESDRKKMREAEEYVLSAIGLTRGKTC